MRIASIIDISLVDVPKIPVTVLFTAGCNMNCSYCQNAEIIPLESGTEIPIPEIVERVRGNLTDGYCITGGEPTIQKDLPELLKALREDGANYINLNTQGSVPDVLEKSLPYLDSVWFDVKSVPERYTEITRVKSNPWPRIQKSIQLVMRSKAAFWPRTTYVGRLMSNLEIVEIARLLGNIGYTGEYLVQNFLKSAGTRESDVAGLEEPDIRELEEILDSIPEGITMKLEWR
ncbi:anaerobic ribonucleoside-triphosphate reductase activating protein [Candidatus Thorarchaeota archaeon]|nr:MAG: anaerobic ribonucleoside-triphosphate reductase activating protein [Candidatus Thorarchaeota archaeon]